MSVFFSRLDALNPDHDPAARDWIFVPYDQLSHEIGPLADRDPASTGVVLVERRWKGDRRPYHTQKLALILANQRHFALEQARRGVAVRYLVGERRYGAMLEEFAAGVAGRQAPLTVMEPAERELRVDLQPLVDRGGLEVVPHAGWPTAEETFRNNPPTFEA